MRNRRKLSPLAGAMIEGLEPRFMLTASAVPGTPDLRDAFDTGTYNYDNLTKLDNSTADAHLEFQVGSTKSGATINLYCDGLLIGTAAGASPSTIVATNGSQDLLDGSHVFTARQIELGMDESADSAGLTVTIDTVLPVMVAPDPTFGTGGILNLQVPNRADWLYSSSAVQSDGKTVIAQCVTSGSLRCFCLIRLDLDGSVDPTFGTSGQVVTQAGTGTYSTYMYGVTLQPDGKILALGQASDGSNAGFAVVRYDASGNLDPTFGSGGIVITMVGSLAAAYSAAIQPDGKIVVAGASQGNYVTARYDSSGNLDPEFGTGGIVVTQVSSSYCEYIGVLLQPDGKIVVTGDASSRTFVMCRYDTDGNLDTSFGTGGKAAAGGEAYHWYGFPVGMQPDGSIIVGGFGQFVYSGMVRFDADGHHDTQFENNVRQALSSFTFLQFSSTSLVVQPDGKIIMWAASTSMLIRLNGNGTLDRDFYAQNILTSNAGFYMPSLTVTSGGNIIMAGDSYLGMNTFTVARFCETNIPTLALQPNSDTGVSNTDGITSATTLRFTCKAGSSVHSVYRDGVALSPTLDFSGNPQYENQPVGTHNYTITAMDAAGNESPLSAPFVVNIITTRPAAPAAPTLLPGSDSGNPADNITNVNAPTLSVTGSPYFRIFVDGTGFANVYLQGATYMLSKLTDGVHNVKLTAVDVAGNESNYSPALSIMIDIAAPLVGVDNLATGDTSPALTGTVSDATSGAASGCVTVNGQAYAISVSGQTAWSLPAGTISPALDPGIYTVSATAADVAGNSATVSGQLLVAWPGDSNCDGTVAFADYQILEAHFGLAGQSWSGGDFDGDGAVSFADYQILESHFGRSLDLAAPAKNQTLSFSADSLALITGSSPAGIPLAAVSRQRAASGAAALALSARLGDSTACPIRPMEFKFAESTCLNSLPGNGTRIPPKDRPAKAAPARRLELGIQPDDLLAIAL